ncbi:tryptophan synthase subunit alpha [Candidatus Vidania fulgoroideorum]
MKNIFIPFLIANYPNSQTFIKRLYFLLIKGIKTVEIGIPCSESYSDGKIISKVYNKVIKKFSIFSFLSSIKKFKKLKKILVIYSNIIENFKIKKLLKKIKNSNYSLLVVDQPIKYIFKFKKLFLINKVKIVYITSINKSIKKIKKVINKFGKYKLFSYIYITNRLGVTGNKYVINYKKIKKKYKIISKLSNIPVIMGFGINKKNFSFFKENRIKYVIGTELIKLINNKKIFKNFIKKCIK